MDKRFFENLLRDKKISLRGLARRLDILPSQLSLTLSGKRRMQLGEAVQIAQIFGLPLQEIAIHAGIQAARADVARVRVTGILKGDGTIGEQTAIERTPADLRLPEHAEAIHARTSDSPLSWLDGWVMFTDERSAPSDAIIGRLCRVKIAGGPEALATVRRGYRSGTYSLFGPYNAESQQIEWAAPVLYTRHG